MSTLPLHPLRWFAHRHDELPAFHAAFLALTFLAAALFNVGFFVLLVLGHMSLDVVKYREVHHKDWRTVGEGVLRENVFDIAVLHIALVFAVYLDHTMGLAGVTGVVRSQATLLRLCGTVVPKFTVLTRFLEKLTHVHRHLMHTHTRLGLPFSSLERFSLFVVAGCIVVLIAAASIMNVEAGVVGRVVWGELVPWNL